MHRTQACMNDYFIQRTNTLNRKKGDIFVCACVCVCVRVCVRVCGRGDDLHNISNTSGNILRQILLCVNNTPHLTSPKRQVFAVPWNEVCNKNLGFFLHTNVWQIIQNTHTYGHTQTTTRTNEQTNKQTQTHTHTHHIKETKSMVYLTCSFPSHTS